MEREHLIKPVLDHSYPTVQYGKGVFLYDEQGKAYLDASSGAVTAGIGHGVQEIIDAMMEQAGKVSFVYRSQFTSEPAEKLAKKLSDMAPGGDYWAFFVNSGSEATETAMKIAIQHWQEKGRFGKNMVISRRMSYHGITMGALSMSGHVLRRRRFIPLLEDYPVVAPPYCYRCPLQMTAPSCKLACADDLETAIKRIGAEHIAAFIAEPIVGAAGGAIVPPEGYYKKIKEILYRYEILFIADEVMTGIARTGTMFGMQHDGVEPDLMALGKGLSAGYTPMAATLVKDNVMAPILQGSKSIMAGHTYSANPQSAAVSLAVLGYVERHQLAEAAQSMGAYLLTKLREMAEGIEIIGDVRGKGLLLAIEFVRNRDDKAMFPPGEGITVRIIDKAFHKGLLVYPASGAVDGAGDAIIVAPPLVITEAEVDQLVQLLEEAIREVADELTRESAGGDKDGEI
ncbi:aspartate aminotransferase family protein [Paenibacillus aceris]|uniref:Adenosylmethionine-8-amino-7-oxononanoate aminotransferase n=1 Tax=Paenibacillus aceris TaxID=869555 RepID=A0ABS4I9F4_9BACL|nr:aspartate aminotransferase family protein [Paenibacillus aceris]MBP1967493.1 adenosylmethionine-8-amino-7-oxononanoate aminotransferase [Paenibacillus aceris]NHW35167.1 aspartate aminotransferase family protein [Paenibacillus aceris]